MNYIMHSFAYNFQIKFPSQLTMATVFLGIIVHSRSIDCFEIFHEGFLAFDANGTIIGVGCDYKAWCTQNQIIKEITLTENQFIMPGFIDCHIHAPQFAQYGLGLDMELLDWLNAYTFPLEAKFTDKLFAKEVYEKVVETTIKCGTTTASYFGSNDKDSTLILVKEALRQGQRALVGKVCSDCNSPHFYVEQTLESVNSTRGFIETVLNLQSDLVRPTITPRFALSCSKELLTELADIALEYNLHIQSHISESVSEIDFVKSIFETSYAHVYDWAGLLTNKTVLAHGVHLDDDEIRLLKKRGTGIAHCPASNTMLNSGLCDVRRLLEFGVKVGLGTDVSGGNSVSIQDAILRTLDVSKHLYFIKSQDVKGSGILRNQDTDYKQLKFEEVLYLATLGGAEALDLDKITGNFKVGKKFDGLLIDISVNATMFRPLRVDEMIKKFIFTGDDRNIIEVYINGKSVKKTN